MRLALWDRLLVTGNYTHQRALDASDDPNLHGNQLPYRPANEAYARVEVPWSPARPLPLGALGPRLWPGRVFVDVDLMAGNFLDVANTEFVSSRIYLGLGLDVVLPWHGVRLSWEAKNLTNDQTEDVAGFPLPGRAFFATVSYGFGTPPPLAP